MKAPETSSAAKPARNASPTLIIIILCIVAYAALWFYSRQVATGQYIAAAMFGLNRNFFTGFYWQLLTSMFMHGGIVHLAMNMAVLWRFGTFCEEWLGKGEYTLLYLLGGALTGVFCLAFVSGGNTNIVGASGAICVLLGFWASLHSKRQAGEIFVAILLMSILPIFLGVKVAWYAHLIGFGIGFGYGRIRYKY